MVLQNYFYSVSWYSTSLKLLAVRLDEKLRNLFMRPWLWDKIFWPQQFSTLFRTFMALNMFYRVLISSRQCSLNQKREIPQRKDPCLSCSLDNSRVCVFVAWYFTINYSRYLWYNVLSKVYSSKITECLFDIYII